MGKYTVLFAGNDISQVLGVDLYNHNFNNLPNREIKINKVARRDLSIITSSEYSSKEITVNLEACTGTRADTENTMTLLKSLLQAQNAPLVVSQGGVDVEYTATMNEFNIEWNGPLAVVTIVFIASDPIGSQADDETLLSTTITTASSASSVTVAGSATAYPVFTLTITSVTGGTGGELSVQNGKTNQGITLAADFVNGDVIIIDSDKLEVTHNGASIDFTGLFPRFSAGEQQISYTDNFTTRSVSMDVTYQPRLV